MLYFLCYSFSQGQIKFQIVTKLLFIYEPPRVTFYLGIPIFFIYEQILQIYVCVEMEEILLFTFLFFDCHKLPFANECSYYWASDL